MRWLLIGPTAQHAGREWTQLPVLQVGPFAPVPATASKLEPRRPGYIGQRLRPLLISEIRIRGLAYASMTFATQRWRYGSADTALRDRLDAFYVVGRQVELGQVVGLRRDRSWPQRGPATG